MIYKTQNTANFTIIDSEILRDESLSMGARMFYALAQSFSDCWNINIKHFAKILGVSEASVRKFRNELVSADILHFEQKRDEKGKLTQESVYTFKGFEVVEQEQAESDYFCRSERSEESTQKSADSSADIFSASQAQYDKVEQEKTEQTPLKSSSYPFAQKTAYGYSSDISNINNLEKSTLSKSARDSENPQNPQTHKADLKSADSHALCHSEPLDEESTQEAYKVSSLDVSPTAQHDKRGEVSPQGEHQATQLPHHKEEHQATRKGQQGGEVFSRQNLGFVSRVRGVYTDINDEARGETIANFGRKDKPRITSLKVIARMKTFSDSHTKKQTLKAELNTQNFTQEEQRAFKDFIAYRKERGFLARSTLHSIIRDFEKLKAQNAPIMQCVELCINRGWSGLLKANEALQNYARYSQKPQARPQAQSALSKLTL